MILLYKDVHYANRNAAIIFIRLSVCLSVTDLHYVSTLDKRHTFLAIQ